MASAAGSDVSRENTGGNGHNTQRALDCAPIRDRYLVKSFAHHRQEEALTGPLIALLLLNRKGTEMEFWALILGLMFTILGGYAFCYGLVTLGEKVVHLCRAKRVVLPSVPAVRKAA